MKLVKIVLNHIGRVIHYLALVSNVLATDAGIGGVAKVVLLLVWDDRDSITDFGRIVAHSSETHVLIRTEDEMALGRRSYGEWCQLSHLLRAELRKQPQSIVAMQLEYTRPRTGLAPIPQCLRHGVAPTTVSTSFLPVACRVNTISIRRLRIKISRPFVRLTPRG